MHVSLTNSNTSERTVGVPLLRLQLFECYVIISIPTMFVGLQSDSDDDCSQSTDANALIDCMGYQTFSTMITDWIWRGGFPNTPTLYQTRCNGLSSFLSCPSPLDNAYLGIRGAHGAQSKWCFFFFERLSHTKLLCIFQDRGVSHCVWGAKTAVRMWRPRGSQVS